MGVLFGILKKTISNKRLIVKLLGSSKSWPISRRIWWSNFRGRIRRKRQRSEFGIMVSAAGNDVTGFSRSAKAKAVYFKHCIVPVTPTVKKPAFLALRCAG